MKNKLLLLISLIPFLSCQSPEVETEQQAIPEATAPARTVDQTAIVRQNTEYLDPRSIRINGKFPLSTTVSNINGLLGKADSILSIDWAETCPSDFRDEDSKIAYYGGYQFEQFGDSLDLQSVDFRIGKDTFLQSNNLKLNSSTTVEELKQHFPNAVKDAHKMDVSGIGEVDVIALPPSEALSDGQWLLMFQDGKLIRIDDWFPC
jgi:hypothetical protein